MDMAARIWLVPLQGGLQPIELPRHEGATGIGRKSTNAVCIVEAHAYVSGEHCRVLSNLAADGSMKLEDLSANGTFINGNRVGKGLTGPLSCGDEISLAKPTRRGGALMFRLEDVCPPNMPIESSTTPAVLRPLDALGADMAQAAPVPCNALLVVPEAQPAAPDGVAFFATPASAIPIIASRPHERQDPVLLANQVFMAHPAINTTRSEGGYAHAAGSSAMMPTTRSTAAQDCALNALASVRPQALVAPVAPPSDIFDLDGPVQIPSEGASRPLEQQGMIPEFQIHSENPPPRIPLDGQNARPMLVEAPPPSAPKVTSNTSSVSVFAGNGIAPLAPEGEAVATSYFGEIADECLRRQADDGVHFNVDLIAAPLAIERQRGEAELRRLEARTEEEAARCASLRADLHEKRSRLKLERSLRHDNVSHPLSAMPGRLGEADDRLANAAVPPNLSETNARLAMECDVLRQKLAKMREEGARLEAQCPLAEEAALHERRECGRLREELAAEQGRVERAEEEVASLRSEASAASFRARASEAEVKLAVARNAVLEEQCAEANEEVVRARASVGDARNRLKSRTETLSSLRLIVRDHRSRLSEHLGALERSLVETAPEESPTPQGRPARHSDSSSVSQGDAAAGFLGGSHAGGNGGESPTPTEPIVDGPLPQDDQELTKRGQRRSLSVNRREAPLAVAVADEVTIGYPSFMGALDRTLSHQALQRIAPSPVAILDDPAVDPIILSTSNVVDHGQWSRDAPKRRRQTSCLDSAADRQPSGSTLSPTVG